MQSRDTQQIKYFLDTEFIERGRAFPIELISIGIRCEDGRDYYAVSSEFVPNHASDWVKQNVLSHLGDSYPIPLSQISTEILAFTDAYSSDPHNPQFWGYYADYDWVVFCQMFGTMMALPNKYPKYCRDLKQWCDDLGNPKLPEQTTKEHNALSDARWIAEAWDFLDKISKGK